MKLNSHAKMETTPQKELNGAPYGHQTCIIVNISMLLVLTPIRHFSPRTTPSMLAATVPDDGDMDDDDDARTVAIPPYAKGGKKTAVKKLQ
jgi:hypothetical protein